MSDEYPSIKNLYASNGEQNANRRTGPEFGFNMPEVGLIGSWLVLDKLDGMNMRVHFQPYGWSDYAGPADIEVFGRTANAQIPGDLLESIQGWATEDALFDAFAMPREYPEQGEPFVTQMPYEHSFTLYGEGIGGKIQGKREFYGDAKRFVLFDVKVGHKWLDWIDVVDVAQKLEIEHVQLLSWEANLEDAKDAAVDREGRAFVEGGILRTDPYVFTHRGERVMAKYKVRDL